MSYKAQHATRTRIMDALPLNSVTSTKYETQNQNAPTFPPRSLPKILPHPRRRDYPLRKHAPIEPHRLERIHHVLGEECLVVRGERVI